MSEDTYKGKPNDPLSLNLYTYCAGDPINAWDPSGHRLDDDIEARDDRCLNRSSKTKAKDSKSSFTYDLNPDINISGNTAYMLQVGVQGSNDIAGGAANVYGITGTANAYALIGGENNYNGTKAPGGADKQVFGVDVRAEAEVAAVSGNANGYVGYKDYVGLTGEAEGSIGKAAAYGAFTARVDGEDSVGFRVGAEAALADGSAGVGIYLFGYDIKIGVEGSLGSASCIAELGVYDGRAKGRAKVGLGLSGGVWFDIGKR